MMRKFAATIAFCLTLAGMTGPAWAQTAADKPLKKITFLTNYAFIGRHSPFFIGLDKGYFRDAGFDLEILPTTGSGFVLTAIDGGKADYGMADSTTMVTAIAKGAKVKAFGVFMDVTTSGFASLAPYPTLESLGSHSIAAALTDGSRVMLPILFAQKGLDPSTVNWMASDPSVYVTLMASGQADMYIATLDGDIPAITKTFESRGKKVYFTNFADWGYDVFGYFFVTSADRIAKHPDEVKAFAGAMVKSVTYAMAHPEEDAAIMVKYNPTLVEDTVLAQWKQSIKAIDTAYMRQNGYGIAGGPRLQHTIDLVKQAMKIDLPLTPDDIYARGFITHQ